MGLKEMLIVFEVYEAFSTNALLFFNEISLVKNSDFAFGQMKIEDSKQRDKL